MYTPRLDCHSETTITPTIMTRSKRQNRPRTTRADKELTAVANADPAMTRPIRCAHFGPCGGCDFLDRFYREEIDAKKKALDELLLASDLAGFELLPVLRADEPLFYRTAIKVPFAKTPRGVVAGFFRRGSHRIVDLNECAIQHPTLTRLVRTARSLAARHEVPIYQEYQHRGLLRHLVARIAPSTGEVLAALVVRRGGAPQVRRMAADLFERHREDGLVGVVENENPKATNVILGSRNRTLEGTAVIREEIDGLRIETTIGTFVQVNTSQSSKLYAEALRLLGDVAGRSVVDLYSGFGPIALRLAAAGASVVAVERNRSAVRDGRRSAALSGLEGRIEFVTGDATRSLERVRDAKPFALVVDPPRRGLAPEALAFIRTLPIERLLYVSCDPETLIRDLHAFAPDFRPVVIRPVDLFPRTSHLEVIARLERRNVV